jgi:hypothetical protein
LPSGCDYLEQKTTVFRICDSDELLITDRAQYFCSTFALADVFIRRGQLGEVNDESVTIETFGFMQQQSGFN